MGNDTVTKQVNKGISGSTLKIIAIVAMLVDHIAAVLLERYFTHVGLYELMSEGNASAWIKDYGLIYLCYNLMRAFGRLGFPIFAFLLVQGFMHTRSRLKYAVRLAAFALISEIPFNLAFRNDIKDLSYQNVFFTLLMGLLFMCWADFIEKKMAEKKRVWCILAQIPGLAVCMLAAQFLKTDYAAIGVLAIAAMYYFRKNNFNSMLAGSLVLTAFNLFEIFALINLLFIKKYNGKKGLSMKYAFYAFYPLHLLILHFISVAVGFVSGGWFGF